MIVTELYNGQGLGNQLWSYVVTRTLALDKGFDFGIMSPEKFKAADFLKLDFGKEVVGGSGPEGGPPLTLPIGIDNYYLEKDIWYEKYKCDIRDYDPELLNIKDNTKIEGYFQSENFILHRRNEIKDWLRVDNDFECYDFSSDKICILNIRGGEYKGNNDLILPRKYWLDAIKNMQQIKNDLEFIIITDDIKYTKKLLPQYKSYHFSIGKDYSIVKNAKYLILANSSFSFFPAWTSDTVKYIIAPKYWARHNISDGFWACSFNLYQEWMWQDRNGEIFNYDECYLEYEKYKIDKSISNFPSKPLAKKQNIYLKKFNKIIDNISKIKKTNNFFTN
jgi:hypothetical protein